MNVHDITLDQLAENLAADPSTGLSSSQVEERQNKYGHNKLKEQKKKSPLQRFANQFKDIMILILLGAAFISFVLACYHADPSEFFEPLLILTIVVINAILGVMQENKAEKALDALQNLSAAHAKVIRDGKEQLINSVDLVPGDLIRLEAGDFVPADARLIKSTSLKSEESALTGESVPAEKDFTAMVQSDAPLGDRKNMVYSGCSITYGTATALVSAIGMDTEMGKIADMLNKEIDTETPLQKKLTKLGTYLGIMAIAACVIIFIIGIINGIPAMEIFMTAVSLAVSAIPEGLPAIVTIVLSIGVQRMVKHNAIIRQLPAVETLGSASVICSDKTGTLTQNRMTLVKTYYDGAQETEDVSDTPSNPARLLLQYGSLCCDATILIENGKEQHIGDPTETSIVLAAHKGGMTKDNLNRSYPRRTELPFDSVRKRMTTVNEIDGKLIVIVKGAFDSIQDCCIAGDLASASKINDAMGSQALRVLALAYKEISDIPPSPSPENLESDLIFLGLLGMIDPPRPEARDAVAICKKAGIRPVMITGDHVVTATAIAKDLGILNAGDEAITGQQLTAMSDSQLDSKVKNISVYARVSPEDKIRIVKSWQRQGDVVAMTGDGVNDAPALKAADIGCAMGITGTDVAKGAADMILTDDNFATIIEAVREGRGIYDNIRKVVGFLLGTNIGEVFTVFFSMLLWHKTPLLSMQLLWINLVTDSMPAVALGIEPVEEDIMSRTPKSKNEGIFANGLGIRVVLQGAMFAILTLIGFYYGQQVTGSTAGGQTMAFIILATSQLFQAYNMRSNHSLLKIGPFTNKKLNQASLLSLILIICVVFTPLSIAFGLIQLPLHMYVKALLLSMVPLPIMELSKAFGLIKYQKQ